MRGNKQILILLVIAAAAVGQQDMTKDPNNAIWYVIHSLKDVGIDIGPCNGPKPVNLKSNDALLIAIRSDGPVDLLLCFEMGDLDIVDKSTELTLEELFSNGTFLRDSEISRIFGFNDDGLATVADLSTMITYWGQENLPFVVGDGQGPFGQSAFGQKTPEQLGTDPNASVNVDGFYDPAR